MPYPLGDLNQDGIVDSIDLSILVSNWNTSDPTSDINNDGIVDSLDLSILVSNWGETAAGNGANVLLVTENQTLSPADIALQNILTNDGHTVTTRDWSASEDYTDIDVVVISIGNPPGDSGKYLHPPVGIVTIDSWRPVGMGTSIGFENNTNPVEVIDPTNPLAGGVSGTFDAYLEPRYITWETDLSASPTVVVTRPSQPNQAVVFAYEAGDTMTTRYATTRHVALGYHRDGLAVGLTTEATNQLLAAVTWAAASSYVAPPPPPAPTGVVASASNEQATISWDSVSSADSYTIKRSATDGGPYTTIETNITTTSYTDINLTNGTTYYYVVSATNTQGESPDSSQVSATPEETTGPTQVALLVSSDELAMWQDRAQNGPFRVTGDFSSNSPGHWTEMAACMNLDFTSERWSGPTNIDSSGRVVRGGLANDPPGSVKRMAHDMMSAAYAAFITGNNAVVVGDSTLAQTIVNEIQWHAQQPLLDFGNQTLWPYDYYYDINPLFIISIWALQLAMAYDACTVLVSKNTTVEGWFNDLAYLCEDNGTSTLVNQFPNRASNNYTSRASFVDTNIQATTRLGSGDIVYHLGISRYYNNRRDDMAGLVGFIGAMLDDTFLKEEFKRYMREWLMFGNRTTPNQETFGDHNRGTDSFPQLCFSYDLGGLARMMPAIEALARQGDTSLYDFSSSEGSNHSTWGSAHLKTMKEAFEQRIAWIAQTNTAQYTGSGAPPSSSVAGDEFFRIKSYRSSTGNEIGTDGMLLFAAIYYNEPGWIDVILRQGTPTGFSVSPNPSGPVTGWRVDGRSRFLRSTEANPHN